MEIKFFRLWMSRQEIRPYGPETWAMCLRSVAWLVHRTCIIPLELVHRTCIIPLELSSTSSSSSISIFAVNAAFDAFSMVPAP